MHNEGFLDNVCRILNQTGLEPDALELELTESVLMKHPEFTIPLLHSLRKDGIKVAVDDFGTGYSSLSYLQKLPLDALKVDKAFVSRIGVSIGDSVLVKTIIEMARNLNLRVIAEGVETEEHLAFLRDQECDEAQGFYFSEPVPPENIVGFLKARSRWN